MTNLQLIKKYLTEAETTRQNRLNLEKEIVANDELIESTKLSVGEKSKKIMAGTYKEWRNENLAPLYKVNDDLLIKQDTLGEILKMQNINIALALGNYCAEKIINSNILEKYMNKSIGEKTKKKIELEIKEILRPLDIIVYLHLDSHYLDSYLWIYERDSKIDVNIYGLFYCDNSSKIEFVRNKIEFVRNKLVEIYFENRGYRLPDNYFKNYEKTINAKKELKKKIENKEKELRTLIDQYNTIGINTHTHVDYVEWYRL